MSDETITLTDLARLAGVGRNAVSNWRRREPDFPDPIDRASHRPRFRLDQIERWAAEHDRPLAVTGADRLWFSLQSTLSPDEALEAIGAAMSDTGTPLSETVAGLTEAAAPAEVFEFFVERAREASGTGHRPGPAALAEVAAACAATGRSLTAHDPACEDGDLLLQLAGQATDLQEVTGKDLSQARAALCARRLRLALPDARVATEVGDSLLEPLGTRRYDLVVCDPPFNVKDWGHGRLPSGDDARLAYGTPPRTEPELAWALHCLALLAPGGVAVVRMPAAVAHRRSGRRIRSELLRWGSLRAVVDHPDSKAHIWVLVPRGESSRLLVSTGGDFAEAWLAFESDPEADLATPHSVTVPLMRLWDEDVDLSPASYLGAAETSTDDLVATAEALAAALESLAVPLPRFASGSGESAPEASLADLERDGLVEIRAGAAEGEGVIVDPLGDRPVRLGFLGSATDSQWTVRCVDPAFEPAWIATVLAARLPTTAKQTATGSRRRILAVKVPRLTAAEQRRRGRAFAEILAVRDRLDRARGQADALAEHAAAGLANGSAAVAE
ncbi:N-6 DNA methylase [Glycomyces albus]